MQTYDMRRAEADSSPETGEEEHSEHYWVSSPLHAAVYHGSLPSLSTAIAAGDNINMLHMGITPLHLAVTLCDPGMAGVLLARGCDVNAGELARGCTPLHRAACGGQTRLVRMLLDEGADIDALTELGATPLRFAAEHNHIEVVELLLERGAAPGVANRAGVTPLARAALHGYARAVESLLARGAPVNRADTAGNSPLLHAVRNGQVGVVGCLVRAGALVNARNNAGESPLAIAALHGNRRLVALLIDAGSDVDSGCPVCVATKRQHRPVVQSLAEAGADLDARWQDTQTSGHPPIIEVIENKRPNIDLLRMLIQNGCDVNRKGNHCARPLQCACLHGHREAVTLLLAADCDPDLGHLRATVHDLHPDLEMLVCAETSGIRPLKRLCRVAMRRALGFGQNYRHKVATLELPVELRHFLTYADF